MGCEKCKKKFGKNGYKIKCNGVCDSWYHQQCTDLTINEIQKINKEKRAWLCEECKSMVTSDEDSDSSSEEEIPEEKKYTIKDIMMKLLQMEKNNKELFKKLENQEKENKKLRCEVELLKSEQEKMKKKLERNENKHQQELLDNNVVINGIPKRDYQNDQLKEMVLKIGKYYKTEIHEEDIISCHKIGKSEEFQPIKVTFTNGTVKNRLLEAQRKGKGLKVNSIAIEGDNYIYINHDLTVENQILFKKTREAKIQLQYKFAWFSQGKILLRKTEDSRIIEVESEDTLELLKKKN